MLERILVGAARRVRSDDSFAARERSAKCARSAWSSSSAEEIAASTVSDTPLRLPRSRRE